MALGLITLLLQVGFFRVSVLESGSLASWQAPGLLLVFVGVVMESIWVALAWRYQGRRHTMTVLHFPGRPAGFTDVTVNLKFNLNLKLNLKSSPRA
jgi:hypothetical protein